MRVAIIIVNIIAIDSMLDIRAARTSNSNSYIAGAKILTDSHLQVVLVSIWQLLSSRVITQYPLTEIFWLRSLGFFRRSSTNSPSQRCPRGCDDDALARLHFGLI